jgi:ABC-2 type transport system permease protein
MTTTISPVATPTTRRARPSSLSTAIRLGLLRAGYETRVYFRQGDSIFFTFLFPIVMLTIFSVAFSSPDVHAPGISAAAAYLPGMAAAGILLSGVQNLAVDIAGERSDGTLKRLAGSPLPVLSYFLGKFGQVLVTSFLQLTLLLLVASIAFGVELPSDAGSWLTLAWVYLLGIATSAILGIALSGLPRTGKSATAVVIPITLVLQFISGVYVSFALLPDWLQNVASVLPLKWMAQGMRAVFLPDSFAAQETTGGWDLGTTALVLGIWLVVGLLVSRLTFRWIRKDA